MSFYIMWYGSMIILIPAIILAIYSQTKVQNTFNKYSKYSSFSGRTGAQIAEDILHRNDIYDVDVEPIRGQLTDNYDPRKKVLRLSESVYGSSSIAAIGVAAHEVGHVLQHKSSYVPIVVRNAIVPVANIGSSAALPLFFIGLLFGSRNLILVGILAYSLAVLFQIVTLPVEYNASHRAIESLQNGGYLSSDEIVPAKKVLGAAALTYVAATLMALLQLLRLLLVSGIFGGDRRN